MDDSDLVLLHRLDAEPVVILGLSRSELLIVTGLALVVWIPVLQTATLMAGRWVMGIPLALGATVATVVIAGVFAARLKRQRPTGYLSLWLRLLLEDLGLTSSGIIRRNGAWDARRHRRDRSC